MNPNHDSFSELCSALSCELAEQRRRRWHWAAWWLTAALGVVGAFVVSGAELDKVPVLLFWVAGILNIAGIAELVLYSKRHRAGFQRCIAATVVSACVYASALASILSEQFWLEFQLAGVFGLGVLCVIVYLQWRDLQTTSRRAADEIDVLLKDLYRDRR